ncbi:MAG: sigma-54-dependent Fis family transcriptional regulator [Gemmatimonadaceae bacterium]|nr:sigma-54-dependent Fis family transcriptional regulator [Gemmatimonadaceae bacterium]
MNPQETRPTILIIDDESAIVDTLRILLKNEGFAAHVAFGGKQGLDQIAAVRPDVIISDIRMPGFGGLDILSAARAQDPDVPVILMTAQASLQSAISAVNDGAYHYIQKPFQNDALLAIIRRAAETRNLRIENRALKTEIKRRDKVDKPIGSNAAWLEVLHVAETVAGTDSTVLLQGESGTGKGVVARYIHEISKRTAGPFVSINCGALPESLLESELFGHVKGSFTGAIKDKSGMFSSAEKGTFFLDEIGETTPATQVKLLRVLQHREVIPVGATEPIPIDTRLIAATNRNLDEEIARGNFRSDLFYRLNVIAIEIPPLRQRREDIPILAEVFLHDIAKVRGDTPKKLNDEAAAQLQAYAWPGNVRELENAIERAVILATGATITPSSLPERVRERKPEAIMAVRDVANPSLDAIERAYISWVLNSEGGNKLRAAEKLGIDPSTLHRKLAKFDAQVA